MKSKLSALMLFVTALVSGCVKVTSECVWTEPLYYGSGNVIDWMSVHDPELLAGVTAHNEKRAELCK